VLFAEKIQQGTLHSSDPAAFGRALAGFLLEFHVEFGQHQKQRRRLLRSLFRRGAMSADNPVENHFRQGLDLLIAGANAQQHAGQLLLGTIPLEQIGHLAAQKQALQSVATLEKSGQILDLLPRTRAGKIQQVGMLEKIPGLLVDHDP